MKTDIKALTIRPETHRDYKDIVSLVLRSFEVSDVHGNIQRLAEE